MLLTICTPQAVGNVKKITWRQFYLYPFLILISLHLSSSTRLVSAPVLLAEARSLHRITASGLLDGCCGKLAAD